MTQKPPAHRRHDLTDQQWSLIEAHLPGRKGSRGGQAVDNRLFINAILWILRTGASWRDLPPDYGDWKNTHRRFTRWRDKGIWTQLLLPNRQLWMQFKAWQRSERERSKSCGAEPSDTSLSERAAHNAEIRRRWGQKSQSAISTDLGQGVYLWRIPCVPR